MDRSAARSANARAACRQLAALLAAEYRSRWVAQSSRNREGEVNRLAVAMVLANYLNRHPQRDGDVHVTAHQLHDMVSRSLAARGVPRDRLEAFIDAFDMTSGHATRLRRLWDGTVDQAVIRGSLEPPGEDPPHPFRTIQLNEFHYLGPDGVPHLHRTIQVIQAFGDGVASHRYVYDTAEATVEGIHGGRAGSPVQVRDTLWAVVLDFPRPLRAGETASLEYITRFHYNHPVAPLFRRVATRPVDNLVIRVQFHRERPPRRVWWAEWEDYREPRDRIIRREEVEPDPELAVHRRLDRLEYAVAGFIWEFDAGPRDPG